MRNWRRLIKKIISDIYNLRLKEVSVQQDICNFVKEQEIKQSVQNQVPVSLISNIATVGAVQMKLEPIRDGLHYARKMFDLAKKAVDHDAQIVIFPENCSFPLLGLIPEIEEIIKYAINNAGIFSEDNGKIIDVIKGMALFSKGIYFTTFSQIASHFGIYIVAGSILIPEDDNRLYNQCYVFGRQGEIVGIQKKMHLFQMESSLGIHPGIEYKIFETGIGKIGITLCMDATYFELSRMLASEGIELLIMPSANPEIYREWEQLRGLWARVQENCLFGVQCCMVGNFAGLQFRGRTSFYAPVDMTDDLSGVVKTSRTSDMEEVVIQSFDYLKLRVFKKIHNPFKNLNYELFKTSLLEAYNIYLRRNAGERRIM